MPRTAACVMSCAVTCIAQQWTNVDAAPKSLTHLVYDRVQQRLLGVSSYPVATWSFDGTRWRRHLPDGLDIGVSPTSPQYGSVRAMGFDEAAGEAVLAADLATTTLLQGTFVGRGGGWELVQVSGEPPFDAAVAFDPTSLGLLAFGGIGNQGLSDATRIWSGGSWLARSPVTRPSPRQHPAMATDRARGRVVLFGGKDNSGVLDDTWEWDGTTWTPFAVATPPAARIADMAWDPIAQRVVLLGGTPDLYFNYMLDCHEWNGVQWTPRGDLPAPGITRGCDDGATMIVAIDADVWRGLPSGWLLVHDETEPAPRFFPAITYDPVRDEVLMVSGGEGGGTRRWNGGWQFVTGTGPGSRHLAGMAPLGNDVILFGGVDPESSPQLVFGDTWSWNGTAWSPVTTAQSPSARHSHAMAATGSEILLCGGHSALGYLADTWRFDGVGWTMLPTGPTARAAACMAYDPIRQRVVLYGGENGALPGPLADTWEWDGTAWSQQNASFPIVGPGQWIRPLMAFDPVAGAVVIAYLDQRWSWNGTTWVQAAPVGGAATGLGVWHAQRQQLFNWSVNTQLLTSTPALAETVPQACGNSPDLRLMGRPALGTTSDVHVDGAPNAAAVFAFGLQAQTQNLAPGCDRLISLDAARFAMLDAAGHADVPFAVPAVGAFRGLELRAQALVIDGGPVFGTSLSGALRLIVGD